MAEHQVVSVELVQLMVELQVETCEMSLFEGLSTTCCVSFADNIDLLIYLLPE